eukprot:11915800-Alexandrium_andersonii.AAC.1
MAEASRYGDQNTPTNRTDNRPGRLGWFTIGQARAMVSSNEDQEVLEYMIARRGWVLSNYPRLGPE